MPTRTPRSCDEVVPARPHTIMPIILQTIYDTPDLRGSKSVSRDIALETFGQQGVPNRLHSNCPHTHIVVFCACVARLVALEKPGDAEKECGTNGRNAMQELYWIIGSLRFGGCFALEAGATCWKSKSLHRVSFVVSLNFHLLSQFSLALSRCNGHCNSKRTVVNWSIATSVDTIRLLSFATSRHFSLLPPHTRFPHMPQDDSGEASLIPSDGIVHAPSYPIVPAVIAVLRNSPGAVPDVFAKGESAVVPGISAVLETS